MTLLKRNFVGTVAIIGLLPLFSNSVLAQEKKSDAASSGATVNLDEIIVTASKRAENVQDIPMSITAIGGADLERRGVTDINALAKAVPNLNWGEHDGGTFVTLRGVGASVDLGIAEPSVAVYVDGVGLSRSTMATLSSTDLERVEVLRGPQGTLYGRNATGGAINFVSRRPTKEFEAGLDLTYGNYDRKALNAFVSGPLSSNLFARVSGSVERRDGYVRNVFDGSRIANVNRWQGRIALRFEPSEGVTNDFSVQYENNRSRDAYQQSLTQPNPIFLTPTAVTTTKPYTVASNSPYANPRRTLILANTLNYQLSDSVDFRSVTGFVHHRISTTFDGDATSISQVDLVNWRRPSDTFSQEINFLGQTPSFKWIVGAYFSHENFGAFQPTPVEAFGPGLVLETDLREKTTSYALFVDGTYSITDSLRVVAGARLNHERKTFSQLIGLYVGSIANCQCATAVPPRQSNTDFLPKVGLQFDLTPDVLLYATAQKGYKSGGTNSSLLNVPYQPERLTAYEAGIKSTLLDGKVTANLSGFRYNYHNLQILKVLPGATPLVENGDARIFGLEGEFTARLTPNLRLNAAATYLHARIKKFDSIDPAYTTDPTNQKGKTLPRSPDSTLNAGGEWTIPLNVASFTGLTLRGDVFHSGKSFLRVYNKSIDRQDAYTIVNLSMTLSSDKNGVSLRAFVNNLTKTRYLQEVLYTALGDQVVGNYSTPRMYGLTLSIRR